MSWQSCESLNRGYEHTLVTYDVEKLVEIVLAWPRVMRFGLTKIFMDGKRLKPIERAGQALASHAQVH